MRVLEEVCCPADFGSIGRSDRTCSRCGRKFPLALVDGRELLDLRLEDEQVESELGFVMPVAPMPEEARRRVLRPRKWPRGLVSREEIRRRYGTKLSRGYQFHLREFVRQRRAEIVVLDHGCGSGGNRKYLSEIGVENVVGIDWWAAGADYLADAHRLPFPDQSFDVVLSTAVLEHCYFPHVAVREIARVLRPGGTLLMGASFWESWHGESFFHFTPNAIWAMCHGAGLELVDMWSGWGFIPAVLSHAVHPALKRTGYRLQVLWDFLAERALGEERAFERKIRTSGSLQFRADLVGARD